MKTLRVRIIAEWRDWLEEHHATVSEVWMVYHKQHTGVASIKHKDALDEALCYGWVDSLVKRLDEARYAVKFTPRKADSRWSDINRKRYAELKAAGKLKPAGIARAPAGRGSAVRPKRLELPAKLPAYMEKAFKQHPAAWRNFNKLPPGERRRFYAWVESAKQQQTKERRLKEAIRLLTAGKLLGLK